MARKEATGEPAAEVRVTLEYFGAGKSPEVDTFHLFLRYLTGGFEWLVSTRSTLEGHIAFIEEWVAKCPYPELLDKALADLSAKVLLDVRGSQQSEHFR